MDSYNRVAIIKQPRWKSPLYSKSKIDRAGEIMCLPTSSSEEKESASITCLSFTSILYEAEKA